MVWLNDTVKWEGHCMNCKKSLPKGTTAYCEIKGIFPHIKGGIMRRLMQQIAS